MKSDGQLYLITTEIIEKCKSSPWDFGNSVLYDLCKRNFTHKDNGVILSKVWLIGRAYSAAIERRRVKGEINDDFYLDKVIPAFKSSDIDFWLDELRQFDSINADNLLSIIKIHYYLTKLTESITALEKRSFSSKYLHFHLPHLFFIYDSRVVESMRGFISRIPKSMNYIVQSDGVDKEYANFACKCFILRQQISDRFNVDLSTREIDNILIGVANKNLNNRI